MRVLVLADAIVELDGDPREVGGRRARQRREEPRVGVREADVALHLLEERLGGDQRKGDHVERRALHPAGQPGITRQAGARPVQFVRRRASHALRDAPALRLSARKRAARAPARDVL